MWCLWRYWVRLFSFHLWCMLRFQFVYIWCAVSYSRKFKDTNLWSIDFFYPPTVWISWYLISHDDFVGTLLSSSQVRRGRMLRRVPWMLTKLLRFDLCVHVDRLTVHILLIEIHCCWFLVCRILLLLIWLQPTPSGLGWHSTSQCSTMRSWTPLIVLATLQNRFASCPSISLSDLFSFWDMMSPRLYS